MSLVVTSSSRKELDRTSKASGGLDQPQSYQNHLRSPLHVEVDSEVAVVSVKCNRDQRSITVVENQGMFLYWGVQSPVNEGGSGDVRDDINAPLQIVFTPGQYSFQNMVSMLKTVIEDALLKAYGEVASVVVTEVDRTITLLGTFAGFNIAFTQRGSGKSFTDKPNAVDMFPYIDATTRVSYANDDTYESADYSDNFKASQSITNVNVVGNNASTTSTICDFIGKDHPLSLTESQAIIYFNGSSASGGAPGTFGKDGYTIGLVRSQGTTDDLGTKVDFGNPGGIHDIEYDDAVNIPDDYAGDADIPFFWDVAFNWKNGSSGQVIQMNCDAGDSEQTMNIVALKNTPTNASLEAKYWDRVIFDIDGEVLSISLGINGSTGTTILVDDSVATFGSRIKPLGITCNQLYPKISIHNHNASYPGDVSLRTYNGLPTSPYYDKNYWGYGSIGTDENPLAPDPLYIKTYETIDKCNIYIDGTVSAGAYPYKEGLQNGSKTAFIGIDYKWSLIMGGGEDDEYWGPQEQPFRLSDNFLATQAMLGFTDAIVKQSDPDGVIVIPNGSTPGTDTLARVTYQSDTIPNDDGGTGTSMFVRLKNLGLTSFNANMGSISNIIYGCPRFDAQGNTGGRLYYEPSERVYIKLNNANSLIVNSLDIDVVDVNEREVEDLLGNTLITFHFRKSK